MNLRHALALVAASLCACLHEAALAQTAPPELPRGLDGGLEQQVRQLALDAAGGATRVGAAGSPRVEVTVGQSLRVSHLKARQWFAAGETVTVLAQGEGFSVAGEAQALNPGVEGQQVRVRTESGRVLTGLPVGERRVELGL
jgi:flagella basal body P-ring formation protein FlgA